MARVLIATDGSDLAIEAAHRALDILGSPSAVALVTVVAPVPLAVAPAGLGTEGMTGPVGDPAATIEVDEAMTQEAGQRMAATAAQLGVEADQLLRLGDPADEICAAATEWGADVVVVGSHGSGFVKRVLMGSVSTHVAHHAPCPVLVVRPATGS